MTIRLRLGLVTLLAATALAGCGKKEEAPPADAAAGGAAAPAAAGAEEKVVNVYNWSDYIDPAMLDDGSDSEACGTGDHRWGVR